MFALKSVRDYSVGFASYVETMHVDNRLNERLPIFVNVSFPRLSCADVELVVQDATGDSQIDVSSSLTKKRLHSNGTQLATEHEALVNRNKLIAKVPMGEERPCETCYGGERTQGDCCITCHDVKTRYAEKGWDVLKVAREAKQCLAEVDHPEIGIEPGEGCVLAGFLNINKVAGNIHVALGVTQKMRGQVVHTFTQDKVGEFDTTHTINALRFGDHSHVSTVGDFESWLHSGPPGGLDGASMKVDQARGKTAAITYMIHLVPLETNKRITYRFTSNTKYVPIMEPEHGKQIAVPNFQKHTVKKHTRASLPGIYFLFDFSPFVVVREPVDVLFIDLVTDLLTLAGGVLALVRMLDSCLFFVEFPE